MKKRKIIAWILIVFGVILAIHSIFLSEQIKITDATGGIVLAIYGVALLFIHIKQYGWGILGCLLISVAAGAYAEGSVMDGIVRTVLAAALILWIAYKNLKKTSQREEKAIEKEE